MGTSKLIPYHSKNYQHFLNIITTIMLYSLCLYPMLLALVGSLLLGQSIAHKDHHYEPICSPYSNVVNVQNCKEIIQTIERRKIEYTFLQNGYFQQSRPACALQIKCDPNSAHAEKIRNSKLVGSSDSGLKKLILTCGNKGGYIAINEDCKASFGQMKY